MDGVFGVCHGFNVDESASLPTNTLAFPLLPREPDAQAVCSVALLACINLFNLIVQVVL